DFTMSRLTFAGALFLTLIYLLPRLLQQQMQIDSTVAQFFGGTSILILVGVVLDVMRQVETHLIQRHYDGFLRKGKIRGRYDRVPTRSGKALDGLRQACGLARDILLKAAAMVEPGVTTGEIDRFVAAELKAHGATSAFLNYRVGNKRFPGHICVGLNEVVVHG